MGDAMVYIQQKLYNKFYKTWMALLTHPLGIRFLSIKRECPPNKSKISLAITHYNRPHLIVAALTNVLNDDRINDIVIYDDCSSVEQFEQMHLAVKDLSPKISIHRGEKNFGPFKSKITAISKCKNNWAILLDSDNVLSRTYVDVLYQIPEWEPTVIYCPDYAKPYLDFRHLDGTKLDLKKLRQLLEEKSPKVDAFVNDGNFFVNVHNYLECSKDYTEISVKACDVLAFNYLWLRKGFTLYATKNLDYYHRVHTSNNWINRQTHAVEVLEGITEAIMSNKDYQFPFKPKAAN